MWIHMYHSDLYSSYQPIDTQGNTCRYTCITVTYIHLITQSTPKEMHVDTHVSQWPIFILSTNRHPRKHMQIHMYHSDLYSSYATNRHPRKYMQIHMYHSDLYLSYQPIDTQGNTCRFTCITVTYIYLINQSTPKETHVDSHVSQWPIFILSPNRHPRKCMQIHMYHSGLYSSYQPIDTQGNTCRFTCITVTYIYLINQSTPKEIHVDSHVSQ